MAVPKVNSVSMLFTLPEEFFIVGPDIGKRAV
jgi:hypothetical protein